MPLDPSGHCWLMLAKGVRPRCSHPAPSLRNCSIAARLIISMVPTEASGWRRVRSYSQPGLAPYAGEYEM
ncbi:Uncharacterised protein [Mycobacteroides abscessus subsp. abscessus]|nr:Uncharacterised protein [Mycobacteroides abscessus subsp. abscessus]